MIVCMAVGVGMKLVCQSLVWLVMTYVGYFLHLTHDGCVANHGITAFDGYVLCGCFESLTSQMRIPCCVTKAVFTTGAGNAEMFR